MSKNKNTVEIVDYKVEDVLEEYFVIENVNDRTYLNKILDLSQFHSTTSMYEWIVSAKGDATQYSEQSSTLTSLKFTTRAEAKVVVKQIKKYVKQRQVEGIATFGLQQPSPKIVKVIATSRKKLYLYS